MNDTHPSASLHEMYREVILDHHRHPRGTLALAGADVSLVGHNPSCGDEVVLALRMTPNGYGDPVIEEVSVRTQGCAICTASGSMMAEALPGHTVTAAQGMAEAVRAHMHGAPLTAELAATDLDALSGVQKFPLRVKCALLPWSTLVEGLQKRAGGAERLQDGTHG